MLCCLVVIKVTFTRNDFCLCYPYDSYAFCFVSDIKDGNLKSILGLFFSLSRFKQQQKSLQQQNKDHSQPKVQTGEVTLDNQHTGIGRNTPQLNGGEMLSRLVYWQANCKERYFSIENAVSLFQHRKSYL